ncbi:restriction modification system DNA specificity subunit [Actinobacillus minor 202]|uniref:Restriction modification system DNA specificity subunit n=1 Tax=Actinobacillus minor 202 TaxID=591023 RepID=A0ABM9YV23_9PAST|nr:restriction endonuclease subunit S [Actinobacillus minor]EEV25172.1 restriction modification system DNA specificity subunit [Actinobacillus minor 202]
MKKLKDGWESVRLGDIAITVTSGSRDWAQYYSDTGAKFIRMTNLNRNGITLLLDDLKFVNVQSNSADVKRTSLQANDILISITAELGKIGFIPENFGEAYINQHTALIRIDPNKAHAKFIAYVLSSVAINKTINSLNDAGAKAGLNLPTIKALSLKLPSIEEQIQITETLSTWDNAIQTTEKLLENTRQQKKALMQKLLNGKDWEETKLQNLCKIVTGKKDVNEGNDKGIYPFFTCAKEHTYSDSYSFECEALLIAGNGVVGQTTYYKGKFEAYQRTYVLYEFKGINVQYLYQYIKWHLQKDIEREKQHGAMPYIKLGLLTDFVVKLPKSNEQQKIAEILSTADQEIETLQRKLECLKLEKGALMQRLLRDSYE